MKALVENEVNIINRIFQQNKVMAKIVKAENVLDSFIRYQLRLHTTQSFNAVEKLIRELTVAVNRTREKYTTVTTEILPLSKPYFALEVTHPNPKTLNWSMRKATNLDPHVMLCGVSAVNSKSEIIRLEDTPHTLIAGITGAGKSILLQMMLLSLCNSTSPEDLELVLIDLKNEDLVPFKNLPHVSLFAGNRDKALQAIDYVVEQKEKRIEQGKQNNRRIVLVLDELAQVAINKATTLALGDLTSIGRSKRINLIAATQSVTKEGGVGSMMKANFTCRLIGKVAPGLSAIATGLPNMYAHLLPGKGSFLRIEGSNNHRFQSYYVDHDDVALMTNYVSQQYKLQDSKAVLSGVNTGVIDENQWFYTSSKEKQPNTGVFPIGNCRELTATEIAEVHRLSTLPEFQFQGKPSLNKLVLYVFGSKNAETLAELKSVLE